MTVEKIDYSLDITAEICPMTFVRAKLLIERMAPGQVCMIRLCGDEPLSNVPRSIHDLGHTIMSLEKEPHEDPQQQAWRLIVRKQG